MEWEYVMLQKNDKKRGYGDEEENNEEEEEEEEEENAGKDEEELDMPPAWCPKLFVNKDNFLDLCPNGEKSIFYKKCRVDFFAECT